MIFRILCFSLVGLSCLSGQKPTYSNDWPQLPREHAYQKDLCKWMGSLSLKDVALKRAEMQWDGTVRNSEHASQIWGYFGYGGPKPGTVMQCEAKWFVLDDGKGHGIEGSGRVRHPRFANSAAVYRILDFPMKDGSQGNPFFGSDALARRALVATAVDLMMTDDSHGIISSIARSDFLGGSMNAWVETFEMCKDVLDEKAQDAFEAGFEHMVNKYLKWGPRDVNTNMDMRAVAAVARLYAGTENRALQDKCIRVARRFLFGSEEGSLENLDSIKGTYFPAGYVGENNGPETTYNGVSYYHLLEARCAVPDDPKWDFLDPVLRAMIEFKLYQYYPDHGRYDGPAGYACRTGNSYVYDQRGRSWRDVAAADLYEEAIPLVYSFQWRRPKLPEMEELINRAKSQIRRLNSYGASIKITEPPMIWEADHKQHWPPDGTFFSRPGWYDRLQAIYRSKSDKLHAPYDKPGSSFSRFFGEKGKEEFWAYRNGASNKDFGFFIEHVPRTWPYGSWAGGSMQIFWSRKTGILLLSTHDKTGDEFHKKENTRVYKVIDQWATDHVWGRNGDRIFTSATAFNLSPTQVKSRTGSQPFVETTTRFRYDEGNLYGNATLTSRFEPTPNGLKVTKTLSSTPKSTELWATIPVYLRDSRSQKDLKDTLIETQSGTSWKAFTHTTTQQLRLTRDTPTGPAHAYIQFTEPQKVRLAEPWQATYQSRSRIQNIQIDLRNTQTVTWSISVRD